MLFIYEIWSSTNCVKRTLCLLPCTNVLLTFLILLNLLTLESDLLSPGKWFCFLSWLLLPSSLLLPRECLLLPSVTQHLREKNCSGKNVKTGCTAFYRRERDQVLSPRKAETPYLNIEWKKQQMMEILWEQDSGESNCRSSLRYEQVNLLVPEAGGLWASDTAVGKAELALLCSNFGLCLHFSEAESL